MSDKTKTVTEEDLKKGLERLAGVPEQPKKEPEIRLEQTPLKKTATAVSEKASRQLRKSIETNESVAEALSIVAQSNDETLETLRKSLVYAAERDLLMSQVIENMSKKLDDLTAEVKSYGKTPAERKSVPVTAALKKGAKQAEQEEKTPTRATVLAGLDNLYKSASDDEKMKLGTAIVAFEAGGQISDENLRKALAAA